MSRARCITARGALVSVVAAATVLGARGLAADPAAVAIPELAAPITPASVTVAALSDAAVVDADRSGGVSGSLRLRVAWQWPRTRAWFELGAIAWRDHSRIVAERTLSAFSSTNPTLGLERWSAPRRVRVYGRALLMLPRVRSFQRQRDTPELAPDDSSDDELAPSQQARVAEAPFDRPTTIYAKAALGARLDLARVAAQLELGVDGILPIELNEQDAPLYWAAIGATTTVTPTIDGYGHAVARTSRHLDLDDRDAGIAVGAGVVLALGPGRLTAGLDVRVDDCPLDGWGVAAAASRCARAVIGYAWSGAPRRARRPE